MSSAQYSTNFRRLLKTKRMPTPIRYFYVAEEYRTNELSKVPGGYDIEVTFKDNSPTRIYKNIKCPEAYIRQINSKNIKECKILNLSL